MVDETGLDRTVVGETRVDNLGCYPNINQNHLCSETLLFSCRMSIQTQNPLFHQQENRAEMRDEGEGDEEEEDEGRIVPQLKIGKDGSIVLDEER